MCSSNPAGSGWTHPRVLMKPLTEPSAYRDTISPMCRKLEAESDILQLLAVPRRRAGGAGGAGDRL